jgi:DNA repair protein RAD16
VKQEASSASGGGPDVGMMDIDNIDLSDSTLHNVKWHRIVLDEAHKIKGRTTNVAKSVYALNSEMKWCLSGTPLQVTTHP